MNLQHIQRVVDQLMKVPYHKHRLAAVGITSGDDLHTLEEFERLPFLQKEDLRLNYPFGLMAVPLEQIVELHASSGTTSKPTVTGYTANDLDLWSNILAQQLKRLGVQASDLVQIAFGYGMFTGGLGWHHGVGRLGATIVPASTGNTRRQIMMLLDFQVTVLICTPSYALYLAEELEKMKIPREKLALRIGIFGAEAWSETMREQIEQRLGLRAYDSYGLSELLGPGVATECPFHQGLHLDSHFYPEVVDVQGRLQPQGTEGELVLSGFDREAMPLLRYRTGDMTSLRYDTCACGHQGWTLERITGRSDDMLIIKGVNLFPSQVEEILFTEPEITPYYQLSVIQEEKRQRLRIEVEVTAALWGNQIKCRQVKECLQQKINSTLGFQTALILQAPGTLPRISAKTAHICYEKS